MFILTEKQVNDTHISFTATHICKVERECVWCWLASMVFWEKRRFAHNAKWHTAGDAMYKAECGLCLDDMADASAQLS